MVVNVLDAERHERYMLSTIVNALYVLRSVTCMIGMLVPVLYVARSAMSNIICVVTGNAGVVSYG